MTTQKVNYPLFFYQMIGTTYFGIGRGSPQLILPLLMVGLSLSPSLAALVPVVPRDTWEHRKEGKQ